MQLSYKYKDEKDRSACMNFLKHSGFWNDREIDSAKSLTKKLIISVEENDLDDFNIRAKYKGFRFNEVSA